MNLMFSRVIDKAKLFDSASRGCNLKERLAAVLSISAILLTSESLLLPLSDTNLIKSSKGMEAMSSGVKFSMIAQEALPKISENGQS